MFFKENCGEEERMPVGVDCGRQLLHNYVVELQGEPHKMAKMVTRRKCGEEATFKLA